MRSAFHGTRRSLRSSTLAAVALLALAPSPVRAADEPPSAPPRGPKYFDLRYQEDWSYLEGEPENYAEDFFDPLKNIDLGGDWRLDIGGSIRLRMMAETNKRYGAGRPSQDTYLLQQYLLHANLRYRDLLRVFVQGIHAQVDERQTPALNIDENFYDFHQAFVDWRLLGEGTPLLLRVGRQELLFGKQRLVSPLAWANTRRRFDGARLIWQDGPWNISGFYARPVPVNRAEALDRKLDEYDADQHFFGVYGTYKGWPERMLDVYYLVLLDDQPPPNSAGSARKLAVHTAGFRYAGHSGRWDYELESAAQFGAHSGDEIFAWMAAVEGGYTFDCPWTPRLALGFDWATGDHDPFDNQHHTFNQLFPLGHKYFGYLDQVARQNILDPHIELSFKPCPPVKMAVAYHHFFLDQNDDALYNAAGAAVRRDRTGNSGSAVGGELDVTLNWNIDRHQALLIGYSHLWPGSFIDQTGDNDAPDLFYLQYIFRF